MKILSRIISGLNGYTVVTKFNNGKNVVMRKLISYDTISSPIQTKHYLNLPYKKFDSNKLDFNPDEYNKTKELPLTGIFGGYNPDNKPISSKIFDTKKSKHILTSFDNGKKVTLRKLKSYNEVSEPIREKSYTWSSSPFGPADLIVRKSKNSYSSIPTAKTAHMHNFVVHSERIDKSLIHIEGRVKDGEITNIDEKSLKLPRISFDGIFNSAYDPKKWHEPVAINILKQLLSGYLSKLQ